MNVLITLRSAKEQAVFPHAGDYLQFMQLLREAKKAHAAALYAFCLMPDYCQVVAGFSQGQKVREFIRQLNRSYEDHLFIVYAAQDFWFRNEPPIVLRNSYQLFEVIKDVEAQPVDAGLARLAAHYPYSSAYHRRCQSNILEKTN
jgi:putative transposase